MGSSMVLAASRQSFAFARDGALPFSSWLYRMNGFTGTPVNTVWFTCGFSILLGLLAFAGAQAINAIFSLSVVALYVGTPHSVPFPSRACADMAHQPMPSPLLRGSSARTTLRPVRSIWDVSAALWRSWRWPG